jgi:hypothetical protein
MLKTERKNFNEKEVQSICTSWARVTI